MTFIFDPDSPPSCDLAEVQHDLTGARDGSGRCVGCSSSPKVLAVAGHRPGCHGDVAYVNHLARRISAPRAPGLDRPGSAGFHTGFHTGRRTDPATSLAWVGGFLCIVIAVAACGIGTATVQVARHWRGALELLTLGYIATGLLRRHR